MLNTFMMINPAASAGLGWFCMCFLFHIVLSTDRLNNTFCLFNSLLAIYF